MTYIREYEDGKTLWPYSKKDFRLEYPNVSLPKDPSTDYLHSLGIHRVEPSSPKVGILEEVVGEVHPIKEGGVWKQKWDIRNKSEEEIQVMIEEDLERKLHKKLLLEDKPALIYVHSILLFDLIKAVTSQMTSAQRQAILDEFTPAKWAKVNKIQDILSPFTDNIYSLYVAARQMQNNATSYQGVDDPRWPT